MKMLVHRVVTSSETPFNLTLLKAHLRVSDDDDDVSIVSIGLAAASELEHFAQIALLHQTVRVTIFDPEHRSGMSLPIGPVAEDATISVTVDGEAFTDFRFAGGNRPYIDFTRSWFSMNPTRLNIEYEAGFGATTGAIPADLAQAIMDQAALHYDGRSPMDAKALTMSPHMARIGARYRGVAV